MFYSASRNTTSAFLIVVIGFSALGFLDDLFGSADARGIKGHLKALFVQRKLTTGLIKAFGGLIAGLIAGAAVAGRLSMNAAAAGLLIALFANFFNLLDLRPGRALTPFCVFLPAWILPFPTSSRPNLFWAWLIWIGCVRILLLDRSGKVMLGDTGSNLIGAVLGLTLALTLPIQAQIGLIAALALFHALAEKVSLSQLIEKTPALRALDRLLGVR